MKTLCCDTQVMTKMAEETMDYVNNKAAMKTLADQGKGKYEFLGGQDYINAFLPLADNVDVSWMCAVEANFVDSLAANSFIGDIHIMTQSTGELMTSTFNGTVTPGIYHKPVTPMSGETLPRWVDVHKELDNAIGLDSEKYFMACQMDTQELDGGVVIDIKADAIREFLSQYDFGEGSIIGLVSSMVAVVKEM